jgi:outer membrane lipoprotein-sorting protein
MNIIKAILICTVLAFSLFAKEKARPFLPKSFEANFEREYKSELKRKIKRINGKITYKFPSNLRMVQTKPQETVLVINPLKTWYYVPPIFEGAFGELTITRSKKNPILRLFDALKQGLVSNSMYEVKRSGKNVVLTFSKKSRKELGMTQATLIFNKFNRFENLEKIVFVYNNTKQETLRLSGLKTNISTKNELFSFNAPPKTKINEN